MRSTAALALIAAGMFLCTASFAQPYPAAPVRIIVPLAPGGGVDAIVRMVAPKLTDSWGQTVTVENHVGAGGTLGTAKVATAPADGLTLLAHSSAHIVSAALRTNLPYDPLKDFVPVAPLTSQAYVMVQPRCGREDGARSDCWSRRSER